MYNPQEMRIYKKLKNRILQKVNDAKRPRHFKNILKDLKLTKSEEPYAASAGRDLILEGQVILNINWKLEKVKHGS